MWMGVQRRTRRARGSRPGVESPERLWEVRLALWEGRAGQGLRPEKAGREVPWVKAGGAACVGAGLVREMEPRERTPLSALCSPPWRPCFLLTGLSPLRSQVSAPADQDLGATRAPGVRMGPGVTPSRSAEVKAEAALQEPLSVE